MSCRWSLRKPRSARGEGRSPGGQAVLAGPAALAGGAYTSSPGERGREGRPRSRHQAAAGGLPAEPLAGESGRAEIAALRWAVLSRAVLPLAPPEHAAGAGERAQAGAAPEALPAGLRSQDPHGAAAGAGAGGDGVEAAQGLARAGALGDARRLAVAAAGGGGGAKPGKQCWPRKQCWPHTSPRGGGPRDSAPRTLAWRLASPRPLWEPIYPGTSGRCGGSSRRRSESSIPIGSLPGLLCDGRRASGACRGRRRG